MDFCDNLTCIGLLSASTSPDDGWHVSSTFCRPQVLASNSASAWDLCPTPEPSLDDLWPTPEPSLDGGAELMVNARKIQRACRRSIVLV